MSQATAPPTGFWLALPDGWVSLDVDATTSPESTRKLVEAAAANDETVRAQRGAIEQMITQIAADAAASGVSFCACYFQVFENNLPVQASLTIGFHDVDGSNQPGSMLSELGGAGRRIEMVELDEGPVVRRSGRRTRAFPGMEEPLEFVSHQYFVPLPNTTDRVALLSFATPTLPLESELGDLFESMARSFMFTWPSAAEPQG